MSNQTAVTDAKASARRSLAAASGLIAAVFAVGATGAFAAPVVPTWQVDASLSYLTGDYGQPEDTDMSYGAVAGKRFLSWGEVSLTVPYIRITSPGGQVVVDGDPTVVAPGGGDRETHSGLGDIVAKAKTPLTRQDDLWPWIDGFVRVKLPTADEDEGLGTGETDIGFGVEAVRTLSDGYVGFLDLGYTFIGSPDGVDYDNRWTLSPGLGRYVRPDLLLAGFYEWRSAISDSADDSHSLSVLAYSKLRSDLRAYAMADVGLSDGAPDFGLTVGMNWRF